MAATTYMAALATKEAVELDRPAPTRAPVSVSLTAALASPAFFQPGTHGSIRSPAKSGRRRARGGGCEDPESGAKRRGHPYTVQCGLPKRARQRLHGKSSQPCGIGPAAIRSSRSRSSR